MNIKCNTLQTSDVKLTPCNKVVMIELKEYFELNFYLKIRFAFKYLNSRIKKKLL